MEFKNLLLANSELYIYYPCLLILLVLCIKNTHRFTRSKIFTVFSNRLKSQY